MDPERSVAALFALTWMPQPLPSLVCYLGQSGCVLLLRNFFMLRKMLKMYKDKRDVLRFRGNEVYLCNWKEIQIWIDGFTIYISEGKMFYYNTYIYIYYTSICVLKFEFIFFFSNLDTQNLYKWNKIVYKNALDIVEEDWIILQDTCTTDYKNLRMLLIDAKKARENKGSFVSIMKWEASSIQSERAFRFSVFIFKIIEFIGRCRRSF